jgi:hypothetical protein
MTNSNVNATKYRWANKDAGFLGRVQHALEELAAPARMRQASTKFPHWMAD